MPQQAPVLIRMPDTLELMRILLLSLPDVSRVAPGGVFAGPVNDQAQKDGCIQLLQAGHVRADPDVPLIHARIALSFMSSNPYDCDVMDRYIRDELLDPYAGKRSSWVIYQPSNGLSYHVKGVVPDSGPTNDSESEQTDLTLLWVRMILGIRPTSQPATI